MLYIYHQLQAFSYVPRDSIHSCAQKRSGAAPQIPVDKSGIPENSRGSKIFTSSSSHFPRRLAALATYERLEKAEQEILQEAADGGEEALGFASVSAPSTSQRHHGASLGGTATVKAKDVSSQLGDSAAATASRVSGGKAPAPDEDRDVRELESMLMGLEIEEELDNNVPVVRLTADGKEAGVARAAPAGRSPSVFRTDRGHDGDGEGLASEACQNPSNVGSHSPVAFTIEEDANDGGNDAAARASTLGASPSLSPAASAATELESTRELLGSITATLTPSAADGGNGEVDSASGGPLQATRSELALVNLMEEVEQEPGGLSELPLKPPTPPSLQPGQSSFDDALLAASAPFASNEGDVGTDGGGASGGIRTSRERVGSSGGDSSLIFGGLDNAPARKGSDSAPGSAITTAATAAAAAAAAAAEDGRVLRSLSAPRGGAVFSLGHERWVKCGFTSAHTVGREGQDEASVGRALRDAANVLALDSVNYFLARCERAFDFVSAGLLLCRSSCPAALSVLVPKSHIFLVYAKRP